MSSGEERYFQERARIEQGHTKYRDKLREEGKLFVRDRLKLLLDPGTEFQEDWLFARSERARHAGRRRRHRRRARWAAGPSASWPTTTRSRPARGARRPCRRSFASRRRPRGCGCRSLYLVDAAGGRISEQIKIFPGRFHAGRIFYNEVQLSGVVPQVCILFGPSPAGSAYLPALTDVVIMVGGQGVSLRRQPAHGRDGHRREDDARRSWAARACTARSPGAATCWPPRTRTRSSWPGAISTYMPQSYREPAGDDAAASRSRAAPIDEIVPYDQRKYFDMYEVIDRLIDAELVVRDQAALRAARSSSGFARLGGARGRHRRQSARR